MQKTITAHDLEFQVFLSSSDIAERVANLGHQLSTDYQDRQPLVIGVLNGAFVFVADLVRQCQFECEVAFVRLASYEGTASAGEIKTVYGLDIPVEGRHVIVVEDIVDSGRTLHHFLDTLREKKPASVRLAALLLKPDALQFPLTVDYLGFEIPDKFVVGYGLDYDGLCRNLPDLYQLAEVEK